MKESKNHNPLRWLLYITIPGLLLCIARMGLDISNSSHSYMIWGIPLGRLMSINPLAPFQIISIIFFLYLYLKQSMYAWHMIIVLLIGDLPFYWILRILGIYFQPRNFLYDGFLLAVCVLFLIYMLKERRRYFDHISSNKN